MEHESKNTVIRRFQIPLLAAVISLWGIMIVVMALYGMSDGFTTWLLPVWEMELPDAIFLTIFLCVWFGFAFWWIWMALRPLQTIRVRREDVQICIGLMVLRRMRCSEIRTVVRTDLDYKLSRGRYYADRRRLICSAKTIEELCDKVIPLGYQTKGDEQKIKKYLSKNRKENRFYMDWSEEAERSLREHLTTSVFIV